MENVNDIFAEFAACFAGTLDGDGQIVHPERLNRSRLDHSLLSLKVVDEYLNYLHENRPQQMGRDWVKAVLWGGAYVGEVIRRNAPREYNWVDFDEFIQEYPDTTRLLGEEKQLGFCALLTPGGGGFTLPINKMLRFIHDGPEDSVYFYAACEVRERPG
ncbi:MAG TPA: hypothetical protein VKA46_20085 [Gemmataceae bacterium]|nr:hypothetical protein [Gemmataceae bacterium]